MWVPIPEWGPVNAELMGIWGTPPAFTDANDHSTDHSCFNACAASIWANSNEKGTFYGSTIPHSDLNVISPEMLPNYAVEMPKQNIHLLMSLCWTISFLFLLFALSYGTVTLHPATFLPPGNSKIKIAAILSVTAPLVNCPMQTALARQSTLNVLNFWKFTGYCS